MDSASCQTVNCQTKPRTMSETLAAYEDWIDGIYIKHCGSSTPKGDSLDTSEEYEEWLDDKFDKTFNEPDSFISLQIEEKKKRELKSTRDGANDGVPNT